MNEWTVTRKWKKDVCIIKKKSYRVYFWGKIYLILCLQLINQFVVIDIYFFNVKDFEFEYQLSL